MPFARFKLFAASFWTIVFLLLTFAKTIVLSPLMLEHWGKEGFYFWLVLLSSRAFIYFIPDAYIRYSVSKYNIEAHADRPGALRSLQSGWAFIAALKAVIIVVLAVLLLVWPRLTSTLFNTDTNHTGQYKLAVSMIIFLTACGIQNLQRYAAGLREPDGNIWVNMLLECLLLAGEMVLLTVMTRNHCSMPVCVWADSLLVMVVTLPVLLSLFRRYQLHWPFRKGWLKKGWQLMKAGKNLYASNFMEKVTGDGLLAFLSILRFGKNELMLFSTLRTLFNTPALAKNLLLNTHTPPLQQAYALDQRHVISKLLCTKWLIWGSVLNAGIVLLFPFYKPIFTTWTKGLLAYDTAMATLLLIYTTSVLYNSVFLFLLKGINATRKLLLCMSIKSIVSLLAIWLFAKKITDVCLLQAAIEIASGIILFPIFTPLPFRTKRAHRDSPPVALLFIPSFLTICALILFTQSSYDVFELCIYISAMLISANLLYRVMMPGAGALPAKK